MKQIIQNLKSGETILEDIPAPMVKPGHVLIKTHRTLVSLGTERMLVDFGKANLIEKARQQPERVKMVLDKMRSDGIMPTLEAVFNKLDQPLPLGYCNAGEVIDVGDGVGHVRMGDRVVSNGPHAEIVCVPKHLVAKIPENITYDEAAFTVISAIGLQGIRLINPTFGETVVVVGMGLIGLITAQLLKANGCKVLGIDIDPAKLKLAEDFGVHALTATQHDPVAGVMEHANGIGADAVVITASSKSNEIIHQAAGMSRKRGRIVLVGVIGLDINRADFYEKELSFQVSCSYGPGRYDDNYEQKGQDYPLPFVRWTEQRNFEAVLEAMAGGQLQVAPLISKTVDLQDYQQIYGNMGGQGIAYLMRYQESAELDRTITLPASHQNESGIKSGKLALIGAGNFSRMTLLPAMKKHSGKFKYVCSANGLTATALAKKFGIEKSTSDYEAVLHDEAVSTVVITTRHNLHAPMAIKALEMQKNVFVEKPLALNLDSLSSIIRSYDAGNVFLTVGYNRRYSPFTQKIKSLLGDKPDNLNMIATINAGFIPSNSWVQDLNIGGGRIIGEACHFIDWMIYICGSLVRQVYMGALGNDNEPSTDNAIISLKFENGSQGAIHYFSNGHKAYSKERMEVYCQGKTLVLDNFKILKGYGFKGFNLMKGRQDKGHKDQFQQVLVDHKTSSIIPFGQLVNSTQASIAAVESLQKGKPVDLTEY